jgi:eukaryotic-like serine/threonine-protein kinase
VVGGKYRLERRIGAGGMGEVWRALHTQLDDAVAIKVLSRELMQNEEAVQRFEREARILYKIRSSHICRVLDVDALPDGRPFMVMELLRGHDLATLLETGPKLEVELAVDLAVQLCEALAEAHQRHIVHRDLKPENVFLARAGGGGYLLKLLDFGLSKERTSGGRRDRQLTATQQVMGTPSYMAPEQWVSAASAGPAADQWAVATIVFEMLAGRPPFEGINVAQICGHVLNAPTPSLCRLRSDVPQGLEMVLHKALEKDPRRRYENVGALALALSAHGPPGTPARAERLARTLAAVEPGAEPQVNLPAPVVSSEMGATLPRVRVNTFNSWQTAAPAAKRRMGYAAVAVLSLIAIGAFLLLAGPDAAGPASGIAPTAPEAVVAEGPEAPPAEGPSEAAETELGRVSRRRARRRARGDEPVPRTTASSRSRPPRPGSAKPATPRPDSIFDERW